MIRPTNRCNGEGAMSKAMVKEMPEGARGSVAFQYVQEQVARDMAAFYSAFRPQQDLPQKSATSPTKRATTAGKRPSR